MSVIDTTSRDVSFKLGTFYFLILIELVLTSFVELNIKQNLHQGFDLTSTIVIFAYIFM